jgi:hypothetical protein
MSEFQDPVYGVGGPQYLDEEQSALCAEGISPSAMTGILLWLVRYHMSAADRIVQPSLRPLVWTSSDGRQTAPTSPILIEPASLLKMDMIQARPAVTVARKSWALQDLGMFGSAYQGTDEGLDGQRFEREVTGAHEVRVISKNCAEAEDLAWEIVGQLEGFSVRVAVDMELTRLRVASVPEAQPLKESEKHWVVPLAVGYVFNRAWVVRPVGNEFAKVTVGVEEE